MFGVSSQQLTLETSLDAALNETSGLLYLNNTLITHNDSANTNQLFDIISIFNQSILNLNY